MRVDNNILMVDDVGDPPAPTGGGIITVNLVIQKSPNRLLRSPTCSWSENVRNQNDGGKRIEVPMTRMRTQRILRVPLFLNLMPH